MSRPFVVSHACFDSYVADWQTHDPKKGELGHDFLRTLSSTDEQDICKILGERALAYSGNLAHRLCYLFANLAPGKSPIPEFGYHIDAAGLRLQEDDGRFHSRVLEGIERRIILSPSHANFLKIFAEEWREWGLSLSEDAVHPARYSLVDGALYLRESAAAMEQHKNPPKYFPERSPDQKPAVVVFDQDAISEKVKSKE